MTSKHIVAMPICQPPSSRAGWSAAALRSRGAWVQVARGTLALNGEELRAGDGAALEGEPAVEIEGRERSEVLVFDLA